MGELAGAAWQQVSASSPQARWWWHRQLKKPFFGRFMKPWRWPPGRGGRRLGARSHRERQPCRPRRPAAPDGMRSRCAASSSARTRWAWRAKGFWLRHGHADALLAAGFHVLAFDFNGFGESRVHQLRLAGRPAGRRALGAPALPRPAACTCCGASFGAMHAINAMTDPAFPFDRVVAEGCAATLPLFWKAYPFAHAVLQAGRALAPASERKLRAEFAITHMPARTRLLLIHSRADTWTPVLPRRPPRRRRTGRRATATPHARLAPSTPTVCATNLKPTGPLFATSCRRPDLFFLEIPTEKP